jgi:EF hand
MNKIVWPLVASVLLMHAGLSMAADPMPAPVAAVPQPKHANKLDADGDGFVSREEAQASKHVSARFNAVDTDRDGRLSAAEIKTYQDSHPSKAGKSPKGFSKLDANGDQVITRDEASKSAKSLAAFEAADTDKDGRVTLQEAQAYRQTHAK